LTPVAAMTTPLAIRARQLQERLQAGEPIQLVDVREDQELAMARLDHPVIHLPLSRAAEWMDRVDTLLERDQPVAVLCHAGIRSYQFGCWLIEQEGFTAVLNLQGGIDAWSAEVDPAVPRY